MKLQSIICFSLFLTGCAQGENTWDVSECSAFAQCSDNHINVYASQDFTPEERIIWQNALADWSNVANENNNILIFNLHFVPNEQLKKTNRGENNIFYIFREHPGDPNLSGWTSWENHSLRAFILVSPNHDDKGFLYRHEIGHALHLLDYKGIEKSVMRSNGYETISKFDKQTFKLLWQEQAFMNF